MSFNPFNEKSVYKEGHFFSWKELAPKPYNKNEVDPYTRVRAILACGAEFESVWNSHQFHRHEGDNDIRRTLAVMRRQEQQQQKRLAALKPINESVLELTMGYEQLAVDLTAMFAERESDKYVKQALDFALLEDFDHLYRYADLLEMDKGVRAEQLVGKYTECMPGRPTIAEHRYPSDDVKRYCNFKKTDALTKLQVSIITAAEQQTMNFYMNQGAFYQNKLGRQLYTEIGMIEEQHVSLYGSLKDVHTTWLESLLMNEYAECYLYFSLMHDETDPYIKKIYEQHLDIELNHLHTAAELLAKYEDKAWQQVIPKGEFPELIKFESKIDYVRKVINDTITLTGKAENYVSVDTLDTEDKFFSYQADVNTEKENAVASHNVIDKYIADNGKDYRVETKAHPIPSMRNRERDNTTVGR